MGSDGKIRGAVLKVASRSDRPTTLQRPVSLLYPLEIKTSCDSDSTPNQQEENVPEHTDTQEPTAKRRHPTRKSAIKARHKIKNWIDEENN